MTREKWHKWLDEMLDEAERKNLHVTTITPAETEVAVKGRRRKKEHVITHKYSLAPSSFKTEHQDDISHLLRFRSVSVFLIPKWCLSDNGSPEKEE